jgi:predicted  nucleic acid-binding Zn-ribbon protein
VASRGSGTADIGRRRMDDQRSELEDAVEDWAAAKLKPATDIKHREWREVLRDVQAVREGLDGTSSSDSSAYEALARLKQGHPFGDQLAEVGPEAREATRRRTAAAGENERLREELAKFRP